MHRRFHSWLVLLAGVVACSDFDTFSFDPPLGTADPSGLDACLAAGVDRVTCVAQVEGEDAGRISESACQQGDQARCSDQLPEICSDGSWLAQSACSLECVAGTCTECTSGTRCKDGTVETCRDGFWGEPQKCAATCEQGQCVDTCTEGRTQCNGSTLQRCTGGEYVDAEYCEIACLTTASGDACGGECQPSVSRCAEGSDGSSLNATQSCTPDAQWSNVTTDCGSSFCVNGACKPCQPAAARCGATGPELCSADGEWVPQAVCTGDTPACLGGVCVVCSPGERRCSEGAVERCGDTGAAWLTEAVCSGDTPACIDSAKACGRCAQGDRQCSGDTVLACDGLGNFVANTTCSGLSPDCVDGRCRACDPATGETRCVTSTSLQRCAAGGDWGATTPCSGDTPLCREDLGRCGCEENARRCASDGTPERCVSGSWVRQARCSGGAPVCLASTGQCVACQPGSEICQNSIVQRCDSLGAYQSTGQCGSAQRNCGNCGIGGPCNVDGDCRTGACVNGSCAECRPNDRQCVNSTPRTCSGQGTWVNAAACTGDTPLCIPQTATCACTEGTFRCAGTSAESQCVDGQFVESACASGSACDSSGRCVDTRKQQGAACTSAAECLSNFCADGVCCNEACNGACETCETTGLCRMPADDPDSCPVIACSELDAQCVATSMDIATNRCASKGVCKTTTACGFNDGLSCQASADGEGVCAQGSCPPRTVLCGATECEVSSRSQCCVPTNGDPPRCITDDGVTPAADTCADGFTAGCDQQSDCSAGESCGSSGVGEALVCAASGPLTLCESPAISASGSVEGCSTCDGPNPANGWTFCAE